MHLRVFSRRDPQYFRIHNVVGWLFIKIRRFLTLMVSNTKHKISEWSNSKFLLNVHFLDV